MPGTQEALGDVSSGNNDNDVITIIMTSCPFAPFVVDCITALSQMGPGLGKPSSCCAMYQYNGIKYAWRLDPITLSFKPLWTQRPGFFIFFNFIFLLEYS